MKNFSKLDENHVDEARLRVDEFFLLKWMTFYSQMRSNFG